jgi:hypothetical protein
LTELVGDVVLKCTGGSPTPSGQTILASSLTIVLNTAVTSRLMGNASVNSEALLLIDEPGSQSNPAQLACNTPATGCTVTGVAGPEPFNGANGRPNIFQGTVSGSSVTFSGVPIDPPGSGTRVYRITNIRANASGITPGPGGTPGVITASIIPGGPASVPIANPTLIAAYVQAGLSLSVRDSANAGPLAAGGFAMAQGIRQDPSGVPAVYLRFTEGFAAAFEPRTSASFVDGNTSPAPANQNVPGLSYNSESGFTIALTGGTAGRADYGTRLRAVHNNIPPGVRTFVATTSTGGASRLARLIFSDAGAFLPMPASDTFGSFAVAEITVVNGTASATWEVLSADANSSGNYDIPVWFIGTPTATGAATVSGSFAPAPPIFNAVDGATAQGSSFTIPRFAGASSPVSVLQVTATPTSSVLSVSPASLSFNYQTGLALPAAQTVALSATGFALNYTTSNNGNPWLSVTPSSGSTPANLTVSVNVAGLAVGIYGTSVLVSAPGASNNPVAIPVTLTVTAAPFSGPITQTLSHIADGAGWRTLVILLNMDSAPVTFTLKFWDESGKPWRLPLGADGFQSQIVDTIPVGGSRTIQSDGFFNALSVGSAELSATGAIGGTAVFAFQIAGQPDTEAAVPITTLRGRRFLLPFDSTSGFATGVAVANPSATQPAVVSVIFRNQAGQTTSSVGPYVVAPHGHVSFVVPSSAGARGVAEFASPSVDVVGLGIRSHGRAFTSVETQSSVPAGNKTISHIADGGGWKTTIVLVNTDSQPAPFTLRFRGDDGAALRLSLGPDGRVTTLTGTIAPGGSRTIQTDGTAITLETGWAQLATSFAVGGTAIFGAQMPGQPDSEAAVPIISGGGDKFLLSFDGSSGFGTGVG